jgi:hypothetical protein
MADQSPLRPNDADVVNPVRFYPSAPFEAAKRYAEQTGADLTVPNGPGIGDIICFTRLVEDFARNLSRPIRLLTAPMRLKYGRHRIDSDFPVWENNPFVAELMRAESIDASIMDKVIVEKDNHFQYSHVIYNIGFHYDLPPDAIRPSLFLTFAEMQNALATLEPIRRPVICLHPSGASSTPQGGPWYHDRWLQLIERLGDRYGFVQLGRRDYGLKNLPAFHRETTLREAFALIWASDVFVGFDSGFAHAAAAFNKPSVILWDAVRKASIEEQKEPGFALAALSRWGYPFNKNILILGEKNCEALDVLTEYLLECRRRRHPAYSTDSTKDWP